jgi:hypothetical protein
MFAGKHVCRKSEKWKGMGRRAEETLEKGGGNVRGEFRNGMKND